MALYSCWDWNKNSWAIYGTPTPVSVGDDPVPPRPTVRNPIGANPDSGVKPLPAGAKLIGYEHLARGEVRRLPTRSGDMGDDAGASGGSSSFWTRPIVMFVAGVAVATAYRAWSVRRMRSNKKRRRR